jgi:exopolyphosphatase/guanosine-5'-triphosphate,3'-diphosphate pyrophosphatase
VPHVSPPDTVAAVDLGSNSFHLIVARLRGGEVHVVDRIREMVRLGAGLTSGGILLDPAQRRALECLERFGQRLRDLPPGAVRAVGTKTLRTALNAEAFLEKAEGKLGHPIEIVSGIEEARLIYHGVARALAFDERRRLVMDIGGGSTEFIIGEDGTPLIMESLDMGCVSMSKKHFKDGKITPKAFRRAILAAQVELEPVEIELRRGRWEEVVGASGTLRAIDKILRETGWSQGGITPAGLQRLADAMLECGHVERLHLPGLNPERAPVFPGGLAILHATFQALGIERMTVSDGALREGLLYDLLGRIQNEDTRKRSVALLAQRFHADGAHARRVIATLRHCLGQTSALAPLDADEAVQWLEWAATLHEIGLDIAHHQHHKHGAYIIENADLPGFSQQDQQRLAMLVRAHRRKFPIKLFKELAPPWHKIALPLVCLLRVAVLLNRGRHASATPDFTFHLDETGLILRFPPGWLAEHPLTEADLLQETAYLQEAGLRLEFS